jgi:hypothetical protein
MKGGFNNQLEMGVDIPWDTFGRGGERGNRTARFLDFRNEVKEWGAKLRIGEKGYVTLTMLWEGPAGTMKLDTMVGTEECG